MEKVEELLKIVSDNEMLKRIAEFFFFLYTYVRENKLMWKRSTISVITKLP